MPFTFAHPAAVLPLLRSRQISWTGLILGSMIPDFEYFVRLRLSGDFGHTWWGILYFDVPLGVILALLFHGLVKSPLINNSPDILRDRWYDMANQDWWGYFRKNWWNLMVALAIGAFTHVLWDSFTHNQTIIVNNLPFLKTQISLYFEEYPLYHLLQHGSTAVGLLVVGRYMYRMPRTPVNADRKPVFWIIVILVNLVLSTSIILLMSRHEIIKIGHVVVIGLGGFLYALIIAGIYMRFAVSKGIQR